MALIPVGSPNERQGEYRRTVAYVWECGDFECDCSQVVINREYTNRLDPRFVWAVGIWEGPYHSAGDGEDWDYAGEMERGIKEVLAAFPDEKIVTP